MSGQSDFKEGHATALVVTTTSGLEREARQELRQVLGSADARSLHLKGNLLLLTDVSEEEAAAAIAEAETQCVSRVVPVQRAAAVTRDEGCFAEVAAAVVEIDRLRPGETFLVRCSRRGSHLWASGSLERAVAALAAEQTGAEGEYEAETDWLVSVEVYQEVAFVGVNPPARVLKKELHRQRKYRPGERPLNRAQWKIREALAAFEIELPAGGRVLDVGSAPGGWAAVLAEVAAEVVTVDPAPLDERVASLPNVRHLRCRAEELGGSGEPGGPFDLVTADMNVDPAEAARILCGLAPLLKPGAPAIMTVKYVTRQRRRHEREARDELAECYEDIRLRRMPHNAFETTAVMKRRGASGAAPK